MSASRSRLPTVGQTFRHKRVVFWWPSIGCRDGGVNEAICHAAKTVDLSCAGQSPPTSRCAAAPAQTAQRCGTRCSAACRGQPRGQTQGRHWSRQNGSGTPPDGAVGCVADHQRGGAPARVDRVVRAVGDDFAWGRGAGCFQVFAGVGMHTVCARAFFESNDAEIKVFAACLAINIEATGRDSRRGVWCQTIGWCTVTNLVPSGKVAPT